MLDGRREAGWLRPTGVVSCNDLLAGDHHALAPVSHPRITSSVQASNHTDDLIANHEVDQVWEAAKNRSSHVAMDDGIDERRALETVQEILDCVQELDSETGSPQVVPNHCIEDVALGQRPNDHLKGHSRPIRERTSGQKLPASGCSARSASR